MNSNSRTLRWITGGLEAFLAIPILGGLIIVSMLWIPLFIMLALHIVTLVFCSNENQSKAPSIVGIVTSCVGWIPFVGWVMHVVSAVLLLVSAAKAKTYYPQNPQSFNG